MPEKLNGSAILEAMPTGNEALIACFPLSLFPSGWGFVIHLHMPELEMGSGASCRDTRRANVANFNSDKLISYRSYSSFPKSNKTEGLVRDLNPGPLAP